MPLPEQRRKQLDGIIQQMVSNKESDDNVQMVVNDFVKKYQSESTIAQPQVNKVNPLVKAGEFMAKDTLGIGPQDQSGGFLKDVFQSTIGSKGLAGVAQMPGKVIGAISEYAPIIGQHQGEQLSKQSMGISDQAVALFQKAKQTTDPILQKKYRDQAMQLNESAQNLLGASRELSTFTDMTGKQAIGTSLNAATTATSFGAPALKPTKIIIDQGAKMFAKSVANVATKNFITGSGFSGGSSLGENNSPLKVATDAFVGGLTSAATMTGISTGGALAKRMVFKSAETLMNSAIRISKQVIEKGKSPGKELLNSGIWGTLGSMYRQTKSGIEQVKAKILPKLESTPGGMTEAEVRNGVFESLKKQVGSLYSDKEINTMVNQVPLNALKGGSTTGEKIIPWNVVNEVRNQLDSELGDKFWMSNANPTLAKRASQAAANIMRRTVQKATNTESEFAHESKLITARKAMWSAISFANKKFGLGWTDMLFAAAGLTQGGSLEERVGNAAKLVAGEKIIRSPLAKSATAQLLNKSGNIASKVAGSSVGRAVKTVATKVVTNITSGK